MSPTILEEIRAKLWSTHPKVRGEGLEQIVSLALQKEEGFSIQTPLPGPCLQRVVVLSEDSAPGVRIDAVTTLAIFETESDRPLRLQAVRARTQDPEATVRAHAMTALGDLRGSESQALLRAALGDPSWEVRFESAYAMAMIQDSDGIQILAEGLKRPKRRLEALEAFRRLKDCRAIPWLNALRRQWHLPWVDKLTAAATLYALGELALGEEVVRRAQSSFRSAEKIYAMSLLGSHKITEGAPFLVKTANDGKHRLRETAISALGELGTDEAAQALQRLADNPEACTHARTLAQNALASLGLPSFAKS